MHDVFVRRLPLWGPKQRLRTHLPAEQWSDKPRSPEAGTHRVGMVRDFWLTRLPNDQSNTEPEGKIARTHTSHLFRGDMRIGDNKHASAGRFQLLLER